MFQPPVHETTRPTPALECSWNIRQRVSWWSSRAYSLRWLVAWMSAPKKHL